jgi:hypothetical protein
MLIEFVSIFYCSSITGFGALGRSINPSRTRREPVIDIRLINIRRFVGYHSQSTRC